MSDSALHPKVFNWNFKYGGSRISGVSTSVGEPSFLGIVPFIHNHDTIKLNIEQPDLNRVELRCHCTPLLAIVS